MATQYHTFLGPIAGNYSEVIVKIGSDTTNDNNFVINVVKMYKTWGNKVRFNSSLVRNIRSQPINLVIQTLSDIYWVHRALEQGLEQHGINDSSVNNIISLCELIIKHITQDKLFDHNTLMTNIESLGSSVISEKFLNTLTYLVSLSVDWCLDKKLPIVINDTTDYKTPSADEVYESVSYYCG